MYRGLGFGPTSGREVLAVSYDGTGRQVLNPVERTGGIPATRETGGQLFGGAAPVVYVSDVPGPVLESAPAVVINSSGPAVASSTLDWSDTLNSWAGFEATLAGVPWWGWLGVGVGAWFLFGKGGRR